MAVPQRRARSVRPRAPHTPRERRAAERLPLTADVQLASHDNFFAGRTRDISTSGLFLETAAELDVGDRVRVRVQILDRVFVIPTEVVWTLHARLRPVGLGVRFLTMPAPLAATILAFMRRRRPIGFDVEPPPA
jgi:Tfp pilus assembly protein PilZ